MAQSQSEIPQQRHAEVSFDDTPYADRRGLWQAATVESNSSRQFAEEFDVHSWALPFAGHLVDPMAVMPELTKYITNRPPYSQRIGTGALKDNLGEYDTSNNAFWDNARISNRAMLVHGWWTPGKGPRRRYYCNPTYTHSHPDSDTYTSEADRREFAELAASVGLVNPHQVAVAFGYEAKDERALGNTVKCYFTRKNIPWGEMRAAGRHRMYRTWATLSKWGYYHREIAQAFGVSRTAVTKALSKTEFEKPIPVDPTYEVMLCL